MLRPSPLTPPIGGSSRSAVTSLPHWSKPWPVRVEPAPSEALSSWLTRIGNFHDVSFEQLVQDYLGYNKSWSEINFTNDLVLLQRISRLSRIDLDRVRSMTFDGVIPYTFGDNVGNFEDYVLSQSVLLNSWNDWQGFRQKFPKWRPWGPGDRVRACPRCLDEDRTIALRLEWLLPISVSCVTHECFLQECTFLPGSHVLWKPTVRDKLMLEIVELDLISDNALRRGQVPDQFITPARWFRTLRTLVEELIAPAYVQKGKRQLIRELWHRSEDRAVSVKRASYELLTWGEQREILKVASVGIKHKIELSCQQRSKAEGINRDAEFTKSRHYLKDSLATQRWRSALADGGYDRAQSDPAYASLLGNILYWHRDSQMERAWMIEIYLKYKGVSNFSVEDIRMLRR